MASDPADSARPMRDRSSGRDEIPAIDTPTTVITDITIPFGRLVVLFLRFYTAAIVAGICLLPLWLLIAFIYFNAVR